MNETRCTIAYITAGAGGMYCGSCMHDNTLARALTRLGVDVQLIPTYTPIRTDEEDVSIERVFGGINVFLEQNLPLYRHLPSFLGAVIRQPQTNPLGHLAARVDSSPVAWCADCLDVARSGRLPAKGGGQAVPLAGGRSLRPRLVIFTNMLIAGCAERLRSELGVPLLVTLQGDDAFLDSLPEPYRSRSLSEIRRLVQHIDGFLVHSRYYEEHMRDYFRIPPEKLWRIPLGIDTTGFPSPRARDAHSGTSASPASVRTRNVGYLARLSPEKGLHVLVDAFMALRAKEGHRDVRLRIAGWLGEDHRRYAEAEFDKLRAAGLGDDVHYAGVVDRSGKLDFLRGIDVLSVPTTYPDPKGLYVLEALAAGVPVVQPQHGAFPELLELTGGGWLVPPNDPQRLTSALSRLLGDEPTRRQLGERGAEVVHARLNADCAAHATWEVCQQFLPAPYSVI